GGRFKSLILNLNQPILNKEDQRDSINFVINYLKRNKCMHNTYFLVYIIIEVLNLINVILQMMLIDRFLGGEFSNYGLDVISFSEWDSSLRYDPMEIGRAHV